MAKSKLKKFEVRYNKSCRSWMVMFKARYDDKQSQWIMLPLDSSRYRTKTVAVGRAMRTARDQQPSTLRIRKKNGQIQEERTYPRSRDPRRSKG